MISLRMPLYKIENYKQKKNYDDAFINSPGYIYYKYLSVDLQHLWEINPFAKKNILDLEFNTPKLGKFQNILYITVEGYETIEIPIFIEWIESGLNVFKDFINFGIFFEKFKVIL